MSFRRLSGKLVQLPTPSRPKEASISFKKISYYTKQKLFHNMPGHVVARKLVDLANSVGAPEDSQSSSSIFLGTSVPQSSSTTGFRHAF
jgi:hypothetical protein